jgi:hypothetical protein
VAEDVDVGTRHGEHHAPSHLGCRHRQLRVHRPHDDVELGEEVLGEVESAVDEDVDLHPGEDPERRQLLVELGDLGQLLAQPFG